MITSNCIFMVGFSLQNTHPFLPAVEVVDERHGVPGVVALRAEGQQDGAGEAIFLAAKDSNLKFLTKSIFKKSLTTSRKASW